MKYSGGMRFTFNRWFVLVAIAITCLGALGVSQLSQGASLLWWIPIALLIGVLLFCAIQSLLWSLYERNEASGK